MALKSSFGMVLSISPANRLLVETGMIYSIQGREYNLDNDRVFKDEVGRISLRYIKLPLSLSYKFIQLKKLSIGINGGFTYCLLAYTYRNFKIYKGFIGPDFTNQDVSLKIGPKAWYAVSKNISMAASIFFERGTIRILNEDEYTNVGVDLSGLYNEIYGLALEICYGIR